MDLGVFTISDELRGNKLFFKTTYGLFSYKKVDEGTKLLINSIKINPNDICLDLGCGYGAIGISLAKFNPGCKFYFVDRDFVAIDYVKINCQLNNIRNYNALLSDGFSHLRNTKFNLILSNLPSHISNDLLSLLIKDAKNHLLPNGKFYVVTVSKLNRFIKSQFENIFNNYEKVSSNKISTVSLAINKAND